MYEGPPKIAALLLCLFVLSTPSRLVGGRASKQASYGVVRRTPPIKENGGRTAWNNYCSRRTSSSEFVPVFSVQGPRLLPIHSRIPISREKGRMSVPRMGRGRGVGSAQSTTATPARSGPFNASAKAMSLKLNHRIMAAERVDSLLAITSANLGSLSRINVASVYKRLSQINQSPQGRKLLPMGSVEMEEWHKVRDMARLYAEKDLLAPAQISSLVASMRAPGKFAMEPRSDHRLLSALQRSATKQIHRFDPKNAGHLLVGLVQLKVKPEPEFLAALDRQLVATIDECKPHVAANILWAMRKLEASVSNNLVYLLGEMVANSSASPSIRVKLIARCIWALSGCEDEYVCTGDAEWSGRIVERLLSSLKARISSQEPLDPPDIAHAIWAFAKIGVDDRELTDVIKTRIMYNLRRFEAYDVANVVWALARLRCEAPDGELISALSLRAAEHAPMFQPQGLSNCLWGMATLQFQPKEDFILAVKRYIGETGSKFDAQSISNTLWAFAKLGVELEEQQVRQMEAAVTSSCNEFVPQELSMTLWSLAHLAVPPSSQVLKAMEMPLLSKIPKMESQAIANTMWAFATLEIQPLASVAEALITRSKKIASKFTPQAVSNCLWSAGRLSWQCSATDALYHQTVTRLSAFSELELANALWGMARVQYPVEAEAREKIENEVMRRISSFNPQSLVTLLWATAKLQQKGFSTNLLDSIQNEMLERKGQIFTAQSVANTLWSFAKVQYEPSPLLIDRIQSEIPDQLEHFNAQEISNTFWAFAKLSMTPNDDVMSGLQHEMVLKRGDFTSQGVSNVLWSLAKLSFVMVDPMFSEAIETQASSIVNTFSPQEIANTIWAYGQMRMQPSRRFLSLMSRQATTRIEDWKPEEISGLLWGLVKLSRHPEGDLSHWIQRQAVKQSSSFTEQGRGVVVWALEQLNIPFIDDMLEHFIPDAEYDGEENYVARENEEAPFQDPERKNGVEFYGGTSSGV